MGTCERRCLHSARPLGLRLHVPVSGRHNDKPESRARAMQHRCINREEWSCLLACSRRRKGWRLSCQATLTTQSWHSNHLSSQQLSIMISWGLQSCRNKFRKFFALDVSWPLLHATSTLGRRIEDGVGGWQAPCQACMQHVVPMLSSAALHHQVRPSS